MHGTLRTLLITDEKNLVFSRYYETSVTREEEKLRGQDASARNRRRDLLAKSTRGNVSSLYRRSSKRNPRKRGKNDESTLRVTRSV